MDSSSKAIGIDSLRPLMRVRNVRTGEEGTVGLQSRFFPEDGPMRVAVDGHELSYIESGDQFTIIGEERAAADLERCGRGEEACIFAGVGSSGLRCLRYTEFHETLQWRKSDVKSPMRAQREPTLPWPRCWVEEVKS